MIKVAICAVVRFIEQQVFPHFLAFVLHLRLRSQAESIRQMPFFVDTPEEWITENQIEELRKDFDHEANRSYRIVEKGRAGLFMIGVTIALITALLGFSGTNKLEHDELIVLLIGVAYLVLSAICLTAAVNVRQRNGFFLDDLVEAKESRLRLVVFSRQQLIRDYFYYGKLNQKMTTIVANYVSASFDGMRNGIILIGVFFAMVMLRVHWT